MKKIVVNGGIPLNGEITVSGSKNAALPVIFSCFLINGVSYIENLPDIGDVRIALSLLRTFGGEVEKSGNVTMIDTTNLVYTDPDPALASKIRASTYLIGACLSRFGRCPVPGYGGCNFSPRPIDMHIDACLSLGACLSDNMISCSRLKGNEIVFRQPSVGATVNAILLAATADGATHITNCACEPHIDLLIDFLCSCGADITRRDRELYIVGKSLHGGRISVIGDMIEAGSYLTLSLMCKGDVKLKNCPYEDMSAFIQLACDMGATLSLEQNLLSATLEKRNSASVITAPHPGFPTDLQPIVAPLMAYCDGGTITDNVWPDRFGYLDTLAPFGVKYNLTGNKALIYPSELHRGKSFACDLRGGMACLITALSTEGQSEISSLDTILRGYEDLEKKLRTLGAEIKIK